MHLGARGCQGGGGFVRTGQADHLVTGLEQLGDDEGTDVPARAGDEDTHGKDLLSRAVLAAGRGHAVDVSYCHHRITR